MEGLQYGIQQGYNPVAAGAYGTQFGQQIPYGGNPATPLGGLMASGIGGLLGQNIGRQFTPGQGIDGVSAFHQYGQQYGMLDPLTAAAVQQAQLAQQVQLAQQQALQLQLAHLAQHAYQQPAIGRWSPYGQSPFGQSPFGQGQFGQSPQQLPFGIGGVTQFGRIDPLTAAAIQQAQIAQLCQQLALQSQLTHQIPFGLSSGSPFQNQWATPQFGAQFGRTLPFQNYPLQTAGMGVC